MEYFVYKHIDSDWEMGYPNNWELVGTFKKLEEADAKAVELCDCEPDPDQTDKLWHGNTGYETEPRGSELRRGFFGRSSVVKVATISLGI